MLSRTTRIFTGITGVLCLALGALMFLAPEWSGANFSWPLTRLLAMTMGGWYIGAAAMALLAVRRWRWSEVYACLVFIWSFGILEAAVLFYHWQVLQMDALLAWPYVLILAWAGLAGVLGVIDWIRQRPALVAEGPTAPVLVRPGAALFALFVGTLGVFGLIGRFQGGTIWPDALPLLEARGFGAFYAAVALGTVALVLTARHMAPYLAYGRAGLVAIAFILTAAFLHLDRWNFAAQPRGLIYFAAYIGCVMVTLPLVILLRDRVGEPAGRSAVLREASSRGR